MTSGDSAKRGAAPGRGRGARPSPWLRPILGLAAIVLTAGVAPAPPAPPPSPVSPPTVPLGWIGGTFRIEDPGVPLPARALLQTVEPLIPPAGPPASRATFECPVDRRGAWRCALPPGTYSLAIGAAGFAPELRREIEVLEGLVYDAGPFTLQRGEAIRGLLTVESGALEADRCLLRVLPAPDERKSRKVYAGDPRLLVRTLAKDGRFSIFPVSAGLRALEVSCPGFVTLHVDDIGVRIGQETRLKKTLLLRKPLEVAVQVKPPLDRDGNLWTVLLDRIDLGPSFVGRPVGRHSGFADSTGRFAVPKISPGLARLQVVDGKGIRRYVRELLLETLTPSPIVVELRSVQVDGTVRYHGAPLAAELAFSDDVSGARLKARTDRYGRFGLVLPHAGRYRVEVTAPKLRKAPIPIRVNVEPDESGRAALEIEIPGLRLRGRVFDADGNPAKEATLALFGVDDARTSDTGEASQDELGEEGDAEGLDRDSDKKRGNASPEQRSTLSDARGRFEIRFLGAGPWAIAAKRPSGPEGPAGVSATTFLTLKEGSDAAPVELRLGDLRPVVGLVSKGGEAAGGATLTAEATSAFPKTTIAGKDGAFAFELPADLAEETLLVRAPGVPLRALSAPLGSGALLLDAAGPGGTLTIALPESWGGLRERGYQLDLSLDGHPIPLREIEPWLKKRGHLLSTAARELSVPRLATGTYRACLGPEGPLSRIDPEAYRAAKVDCDEGYLEEGEELQLKPLL